MFSAVEFVLLALAAGCQETPDNFKTGGQDIPAQVGMTYRWSFDSDALGFTPSDFIPVLGTWQVAAEVTAPSASNVLRQSATFGNPDFPRVLERAAQPRAVQRHAGSYGE